MNITIKTQNANAERALTNGEIVTVDLGAGRRELRLRVGDSIYFIHKGMISRVASAESMYLNVRAIKQIEVTEEP